MCLASLFCHSLEFPSAFFVDHACAKYLYFSAGQGRALASFPSPHPELHRTPRPKLAAKLPVGLFFKLLLDIDTERIEDEPACCDPIFRTLHFSLTAHRRCAAGLHASTREGKKGTATAIAPFALDNSDPPSILEAGSAWILCARISQPLRTPNRALLALSTAALLPARLDAASCCKIFWSDATLQDTCAAASLKGGHRGPGGPQLGLQTHRRTPRNSDPLRRGRTAALLARCLVCNAACGLPKRDRLRSSLPFSPSRLPKHFCSLPCLSCLRASRPPRRPTGSEATQSGNAKLHVPSKAT